jgi:hypothetical protein
MNNSEPLDEKLVQYLDGELSGDELSAFENLLGENTELKAEYENLKLAKLAVEHYGLKAQVASLHGTMMDDVKNSNSNPSVYKSYPFIRNTLKIAASLFLFLFLFTAWQYITVTPSKLIDENYQPYKVSVARGEASASVLENDFSNGNYNLVISDYKKLTQPGVKDHFLTGQAYLSLHQPANAIREFNAVYDNPGNQDFKDDAEYYMAISYLENNELLKAKQLFNKIRDDKDHLYHKKVSYWTMLRLNLLIFKNHSK